MCMYKRFCVQICSYEGCTQTTLLILLQKLVLILSMHLTPRFTSNYKMVVGFWRNNRCVNSLLRSQTLTFKKCLALTNDSSRTFLDCLHFTPKRGHASKLPVGSLKFMFIHSKRIYILSIS